MSDKALATSNKVVFRRIHGHIVPIRVKQDVGKPNYANPKAIGNAVVAGVSAGFGALASSHVLEKEFLAKFKTTKLTKVVGALENRIKSFKVANGVPTVTKISFTKAGRPRISRKVMNIFEHASDLARTQSKAAILNADTARLAKFKPILATQQNFLARFRKISPKVAIGVGVGAAVASYIGAVALNKTHEKKKK